MKAMIFAAGLGTRLKPLTDTKPKALVEVNGKTMLEHAISKLQDFGVDEIVINVHHFANQIIDFLKQHKNFGIKINISDESKQLLDTGGGLIKAENFFDKRDSFFIYNVDVISDIDLKALYRKHIETGSIATLAVQQRESSRYLLFNDELKLLGWKNTNTDKIIISKGALSNNLIPLAFSGIHVISPRIFKLVKISGKFSMTDVYLKLSIFQRINGFRHDDGFWIDLGTPENIEEAEKFLQNKKL